MDEKNDKGRELESKLIDIPRRKKQEEGKRFSLFGYFHTLVDIARQDSIYEAVRFGFEAPYDFIVRSVCGTDEYGRHRRDYIKRAMPSGPKSAKSESEKA